MNDNNCFTALHFYLRSSLAKADQMKFLVSSALSITIVALLVGPSFAQEEGIANLESINATKRMLDDAKESLKALNEQLVAENWTEVKALMTDKGQKDFCTAIMLFPGTIDRTRLPDELLEQLKRLDEILEKHKIEINASPFEREEARAIARKVLGTVEEPWKVVDELWKECKGNPFFNEPLLGNVESAEVYDSTVVFELKQEPAEESGEVQVLVVVPSTYVVFEHNDGSWKYGGVDIEKTDAALKRLIEEMRGGMGSFGLSALEPKQMEDPSFSGKTVDDKEVSLADYKGKVILVDFWGTWCQPCVEALPQLQMIHEELNSHGFDVVGIAADDVDRLNEFFDKHTLPWKNIVDPDGKLSEHFGIKAYPTTLLIDKKGNHVSSNLSIKELLNELKSRLGLSEELVESLNAKLKASRNSKRTKADPNRHSADR